jgi:DNA repair exonuclease SbcCD nuclease subunit
MAALRTMMARRIRIQYASDLHLEFVDKVTCQPILKPIAPYLALAGDVGRPDKRAYRDFLNYCSRNWDDVFVVAGNHEFYNSRHSGNWRHMPAGTVETVPQRMKQCTTIAAEFPNVHFLDRRRVDRAGVAFLGATLWTDLRGHESLVSEFMNDYKMIAVVGDAGVRPLQPADTLAMHMEDRAWLDAEISACEEEGRPAVVITHHLPTFDLISDRYRDSPLNAAFASRADDLIRAPVRAWIAGHTHCGIHRTWTQPDGAVILGAVNPRGYPNEQGTGYSREIFVDISTEPGSGGDTRDPLLVAAAAPIEDIEFI